MKTLYFYLLENPDSGDVFVAQEARLKRFVLTDKGLESAFDEAGKPRPGEPVTRAAWHQEHGGRGKWLGLNVHPAKAGLERRINERAREGNDLIGWNLDALKVPAARFAVVVDSWGYEAGYENESGPTFVLRDIPADEAAFLDMHINQSDAVDEALRRHLRPQMTDDADFLATVSGNSKT